MRNGDVLTKRNAIRLGFRTEDDHGEEPSNRVPGVDNDFAEDLEVPFGGGGGFATRIPFDKGRRVYVSQGAGGGWSHNRASTANAADLAAAAGTNVRAGFSGSVAAARGGCPPTPVDDCNGGWGNYVLLKHPDGTCAMHAHLQRVDVSVGQAVPRYTSIGAVGNSGYSRGAHLHYDRTNCASSPRSIAWGFVESGPPRTATTIISANEPGDEGGPGTGPPPASLARIGIVDETGRASVKEGGLDAPYVFEGAGIKEIELSGNRIGIVDETGRASVKEGGLDAPYVFEGAGIKEIELSK